jgi:hypothetical protein
MLPLENPAYTSLSRGELGFELDLSVGRLRWLKYKKITILD